MNGPIYVVMLANRSFISFRFIQICNCQEEDGVSICNCQEEDRVLHKIYFCQMKLDIETFVVQVEVILNEL